MRATVDVERDQFAVVLPAGRARAAVFGMGKPRAGLLLLEPDQRPSTTPAVPDSRTTC